jgi:hypothetical protein
MGRENSRGLITGVTQAFTTWTRRRGMGRWSGRMAASTRVGGTMAVNMETEFTRKKMEK